MNDQASKANQVPNGFAAAMEELERILGDLEEDRVGIDDLAACVRRAGELVSYCRERITRTRMEIDQIVSELDAGSEG